MEKRNISFAAACAVLVLCHQAAGQEEPEAAPWTTNAPIVTVKQELYVKQPREGVAANIWTFYVGPDLQRVELHSSEAASDVWTERKRRFSYDNGRTWTDFEPISSTAFQVKGVTVWEWDWADPVYDPASGLLVRLWNRQLLVDGKWQMFAYYRTSGDSGRTWSEPTLLKYEPGDDFDPADPLRETFLRNNQAQPGFVIRLRESGKLVVAACLANAPDDPENDERAWKLGALCWVGEWDADRQKYRWTAGERVQIAPDLSSRGLLEADLAELNDGRIIVVWRGSNTATTPGRKWFSLSSDGGLTLTTPAEWKYDDGSRFYSPSSYHRLVRHSVTDKLYWLGNICTEPPDGNSPRYPLVIAEVDEQSAALKKATVTRVDDRQPDQGPALQLSNFSFFENRESHEFEVYLTKYGEDANDWRNAGVYKYRLGLTESVGEEAR